MKKVVLLFIVFTSITQSTQAQINEDKLGAWYMYFFTHTFGEGLWGFQGDIQHRNWNVAGDLEQLLLRGGLTYKPQNSKIKFTLGYGHITTGTFGDSDATVTENRIYQEALVSNAIGGRFFLIHRFRFEQRFVQDQDFRTRYRYNLIVSVPLNKPTMDEGAVYLALYNELFMNAQRSIGKGRTVEFFDRNRFYAALGYVIKPNLRVQLGVMNQATNNWGKNQLQFSLHHNIQ